MKKEGFFGVRVVTRAAHLVPPAPPTPVVAATPVATTTIAPTPTPKPRRRRASKKSKGHAATPDLFEQVSAAPTRPTKPKADKPQSRSQNLPRRNTPQACNPSEFEVPVGG